MRYLIAPGSGGLSQVDQWRFKQQYQQILESLRLARQRQLGESSEASPDQPGLFNEAEQPGRTAPEDGAADRER